MSAIKRLSKSFVNFVCDFFNQSGIHGFSYIGTKMVVHLIEKVFWLSLIGVALYYCIEFSLESWDRYLYKSTVVSIERDYYYWNTSLPSITVCPMTRLSIERYDAYAE